MQVTRDRETPRLRHTPDESSVSLACMGQARSFLQGVDEATAITINDDLRTPQVALLHIDKTKPIVPNTSISCSGDSGDGSNFSHYW